MTAVAELPSSAAVAPSSRPLAAARKRWLAFSAVITASVMDLLDSTVMNVAAPAIRADLGGSYASLQWMAAEYTMALAVLLLVGGRLGDLVGRKRALLIGVAGFTVTSFLCGLAVSSEMLIAARVAQGAFAAIMLPQGFGLARDLFEPGERAKAFGFFGPVMGLSAVIGPIVGGTLLDADLLGTGWRAIFLVNIPVGIFTFAVAAKYLPNTPAHWPPDLAGHSRAADRRRRSGCPGLSCWCRVTRSAGRCGRSAAGRVGAGARRVRCLPVPPAAQRRDPADRAQAAAGRSP